MATIAISGTLKDALGNVIAGGIVTFLLFNYSNKLTFVSGINILVPTIVELVADNAGLYSGNIQGNDTITPSGTLYEVVFNKSISASYSFIGAGPIDLNIYPPI